jgi:hypothetical protein
MRICYYIVGTIAIAFAGITHVQALHMFRQFSTAAISGQQHSKDRNEGRRIATEYTASAVQSQHTTDSHTSSRFTKLHMNASNQSNESV